MRMTFARSLISPWFSSVASSTSVVLLRGRLGETPQLPQEVGPGCGRSTASDWRVVLPSLGRPVPSMFIVAVVFRQSASRSASAIPNLTMAATHRAGDAPTTKFQVSSYSPVSVMYL